MGRQNLGRLGRADISVVRACLVALAFAVVFCAISVWDDGAGLDAYVVNKAEVATRSWLGRDPLLSPKLKIYLYDDATVNLLDSDDLELSAWASVFETLAAAKPRHIVIAKFFDLPHGLAQADAFNARMARLNVPIITAGFTRPSIIEGRRELSLDHPWYRLSTWTADAADSDSDDFPRIPLYPKHAYGPHPDIAESFTRVGHSVDSGGWRASPLIRLDAATVFPHIGLLIADDLRLERGQLIVDHHIVPRQKDMVLVSVSNPIEFTPAVASLKTLITQARNLAPASEIQPGDDVLILPNMHSDAHGGAKNITAANPGGYLIAGVMNSVLTGVWIRPFGWSFALIFAAAVLATLVALLCSGLRFWLAVAIAALAMACGGLVAFTFFDSLVTWGYPLLTLRLAVLTLFAERTQRAYLTSERINRELATAGLVQRAFFPDSTPRAAKLAVIGHFQSADDCGGDWWWHFSPSPGIDYVLIGDVMGHGVPAALVTSLVYASVNTMAALWDELPPPNPEKVLQMLNTILFSALAGEVIMTIFVARFDANLKVVTYANAGHKLPLFVPRSAEDPRVSKSKSSRSGAPGVGTLQASGLVIGISRVVDYPERSMPLSSGDRFVLYTDGAIENRRSSRDHWSQKSLSNRVLDLASSDPEAMLEGLVQSIQSHAQADSDKDDFTLVVVAVA